LSIVIVIFVSQLKPVQTWAVSHAEFGKHSSLITRTGPIRLRA